MCTITICREDLSPEAELKSNIIAAKTPRVCYNRFFSKPGKARMIQLFVRTTSDRRPRPRTYLRPMTIGAHSMFLADISSDGQLGGASQN